MTNHEVENRVLDHLAAEYRAKGYHVELAPEIDVPRLGRTIRPDLVARRDGDVTAVQVVSRRPHPSEDELQERVRLGDIVRRELNWQHRLVVLPDAGPSLSGYDLPSVRSRIDRAIGETERLRQAGFLDAGLLRIRAAWELALRWIARGIKKADPILPLGRLLDRLVHLGEISGEDYDSLRRLMEQGDEVSHGVEARPTTEADVDEAIAVSRRLLEEPAFSGDSKVVLR